MLRAVSRHIPRHISPPYFVELFGCHVGNNPCNKQPTVIPTGAGRRSFLLFAPANESACAVEESSLRSIAEPALRQPKPFLTLSFYRLSENLSSIDWRNPAPTSPPKCLLTPPRRINRQQLRQPPRPALQRLRPAKRNNQRQHFLRRPPSPSSAPNRWSRSRADQSHPQTTATPPDSNRISQSPCTSPRAPRAKHHVSAHRRQIIKPTGKRLSTETRLITSTTALIRGNPFPAITRRNSASADPRYRAGSFPSALYPARVANTCAAFQNRARLRQPQNLLPAQSQFLRQSCSESPPPPPPPPHTPAPPAHTSSSTPHQSPHSQFASPKYRTRVPTVRLCQSLQAFHPFYSGAYKWFSWKFAQVGKRVPRKPDKQNPLQEHVAFERRDVFPTTRKCETEKSNPRDVRKANEADMFNALILQTPFPARNKPKNTQQKNNRYEGVRPARDF